MADGQKVIVCDYPDGDPPQFLACNLDQPLGMGGLNVSTCRIPILLEMAHP